MLTQNVVRTASPRHFSASVAHLDDAPASSLSEFIGMMGAPMSFSRNAEIYGENEPAEYVYKVVEGAVRTYRVLADGRRQIGAFYLPGDVFGLECADRHLFSAEAVSGSRIQVVKRTTLVSLASRNNEVACQLWTLTGAELNRVQDHILLMIKTAKERVVDFLLEMAGRTPGGSQVDLPMSRQDIADYLGLTIETVSRTLTELANAAAIELPSARRVVLRNRAALGRMHG